jgi:uncharacterized protein (UPF0248 family)
MFILGINSLLAGTSYSQSTRITLKYEQTRIEEVLNKIESQSEFYFLLDQRLIDVNRIVSIKCRKQEDFRYSG